MRCLVALSAAAPHHHVGGGQLVHQGVVWPGHRNHLKHTRNHFNFSMLEMFDDTLSLAVQAAPPRTALLMCSLLQTVLAR